MITGAAILKLERYGQLGLKRSDLVHFVHGSLRDEQESNAFALTRVALWRDCAASLSREEAAQPIMATELLVHAATFSMALIQADLHSVLRPSQENERWPNCLKALSMADKEDLLSAIADAVAHMDSTKFAASTSLTEAFAQLLGCTCAFLMALQEEEQESASSAAHHQSLALPCKRVLFYACNRFRSAHTKFAVPKLLTLRTATAILRSWQSNRTGGKHQGINWFKVPLVLALCVTEDCLRAGSHNSASPRVALAANDAMDAALADNICRVVALGMCNRSTRLVVYFRGDEYKLTQSNVTSAQDYTLHTFAVTPIAEKQVEPGDASTQVVQLWLRALPCLYKAFVSDAGWTELAREQRRLKLKHDFATAKTPQHRKSSSLVAAEAKKLTKKDAAGGGGEGEEQDELLSLLDTVGDDTKSVLSTLSQASVNSFLTFMSVIDAAQAEKEEQQQHESADGNTNLAVIFLEQIVFAIHQLIEGLPLPVLTYRGRSSTQSSLADTAWIQLSRLFQMVLSSIKGLGGGAAAVAVAASSCSATLAPEFRMALIDLHATPAFSFSNDMRYNGGLAYQCLGVMFAKVMSPLLETTATAAAAAEAANNSRCSGNSSGWQRYRSPVQETALGACLRVYEEVAPQVVNMYFRQIVAVVASSLSCEGGSHGGGEEDDEEMVTAPQKNSLETFIASVIARLGASNGAIRIFECVRELYLNSATVADSETAMQSTRTSITKFVGRPVIRASLESAVEACLDLDGVLRLLRELIADLASSEDEQHSADVRAFAMTLSSIVFDGLSPTTLTSVQIAEVVAELDLTLSAFLQQKLREKDHSSKRARKDAALVVRSGLRTILSLRKLMDRCVVDLGVESLEKYFCVLEETLWQFTTDIAHVVGEVSWTEILDWSASVNAHLIETDVAQIALQRLTLGFQVTVVIQRTISSPTDAQKMAAFVLEHACSSFSSNEKPGCSVASAFSAADWTALAFFAPKRVAKALRPLLQQMAQSTACGEGRPVWLSAKVVHAVVDDVVAVCTVSDDTSAGPERDFRGALRVLKWLMVTCGTVPDFYRTLYALAFGLGGSNVSEVCCVCDTLLQLCDVDSATVAKALEGSLSYESAGGAMPSRNAPRQLPQCVSFLSVDADDDQSMLEAALQALFSDGTARALIRASTEAAVQSSASSDMSTSSIPATLLRKLFDLSLSVDLGRAHPCVAQFPPVVVKRLQKCIRKHEWTVVVPFITSGTGVRSAKKLNSSGRKRARAEIESRQEVPVTSGAAPDTAGGTQDEEEREDKGCAQDTLTSSVELFAQAIPPMLSDALRLLSTATTTDPDPSLEGRSVRVSQLLRCIRTLSYDELRGVCGLLDVIDASLAHDASESLVAALAMLSNQEAYGRHAPDSVLLVVSLSGGNLQFPAFVAVMAMLERFSLAALRSLLCTIPEALRYYTIAHPPLAALLHELLRLASRHTDATVVEAASSALYRCSQAPANAIKFSVLKPYVHTLLLRLCEAACAHHRSLTAASSLSLVESAVALLQVLRVPLWQLHGDESFADLELEFLRSAPQLLSNCLASRGTAKLGDGVRVRNGAPPEVADGALQSACARTVQLAFHLLSSTFLDMHVFRRRGHLMAPLVAGWYEHIVRHLDDGAYDGAVPGFVATFLFRLSRALSRSLVVAAATAASDKASSSAANLEVDTDSFALQQATLAHALFSVAARHVGVIARHAAELEFVMMDLVKALRREKLADAQEHLLKANMPWRKAFSVHSWVDLVYVALSTEEGKSLLKQTVLSVADESQKEDYSVLFSARERFMAA